MAAKVDADIFHKILKYKEMGLTDKVISIRLGISERTVRVYTRADRTGSKPYTQPQPAEQQ